MVWTLKWQRLFMGLYVSAVASDWFRVYAYSACASAYYLIMETYIHNCFYEFVAQTKKKRINYKFRDENFLNIFVLENEYYQKRILYYNVFLDWPINYIRVYYIAIFITISHICETYWARISIEKNHEPIIMEFYCCKDQGVTAK